MKNFRTQHNKGFTLVEMIFYTALFTAISLILIQAVVSMVSSFRETQVTADINQTNQLLERVAREIRQSNSIDTISSTSLKINTEDSVGSPKTVTFTLSGTDLELYEDDVLTGDLNSANLALTSLNFTQITTGHSTAIRISMTVKSNRHGSSRTVDFYDTLVMRGAY